MDILIIDDHRLFSEGMRLLLGSFEQDEKINVDVADSLESALALGVNKVVDIVLLDYYLPNCNSQQSLIDVINEFSNARVVIISSEESSDIIYETISAGAAGFIPKSSTKNVMIAALQLVISGGTYLPSQTFQKIKQQSNVLGTLTQRQIDVVTLASEGLANKVIAIRLGIAEGTVKAHLFSAFKELGVNNRTEASLIINKCKGT